MEKDLRSAKASGESARAQLNHLQEHPQIPEAMMSQLAADALSQAEKEVQEKLDAANADKLEAERRAQEAEAQLEAMRKAAKVSNPDVAAFRFLGKQIAEDCNRMAGYRMKAAANDPDLDAKMKEFMLKLSELFRARAEGTGMTQGG